MRAIGYTKCLDIENLKALEDIELARPTASGKDLLVKVAAISVNPVDCKIRQVREPNDGEHAILGWDAVGEVIEVGEHVSLYSVGDAVWYAGDITRSGTNAQYQLVDERIVGKAPQSVSNSEAAAIPLTAITAWELLFDRLKIDTNENSDTDSDERLLIIGAAGGVGSILVQLAAKLTGATIIGTASRPESQDWVKRLGAHHVINHHKPLDEEISRVGLDNVTHIISLTHTDQHFDKLVEIIAPQGKIALIDDPALPLDVMKLKQKSISLHWELMFTRSMFHTDDMGKQGALLTRVGQLIDAGTLKTTLGENYGTINANNLRRAHKSIESGTSIGKIVLEGF